MVYERANRALALIDADSSGTRDKSLKQEEATTAMPHRYSKRLVRSPNTNE
jgi:hypothetical protein